MIEWIVRDSHAELAAAFCDFIDKLPGAKPSDQRERPESGVQKPIPVALTGGDSAAIFYDAWCAHWCAHAAGSPLGGFRFFWSDERLVSPFDPDSNFKLASDHLLRPAQVPMEDAFAVPVELPPEECAISYLETIRRIVPANPVGTPRFPLIILGLGEDGHTGSLFPGRDPFLNDDMLVRAVAAAPTHPHARLTFTPRLINAAAQLCYLVTGAKKAWALEQLSLRTAPPTDVPALVADPAQTPITVFADAAAAARIR